MRIFNHLNFSTFSLLVTGFRVQRLPIYTQIPARSAKKDGHNTINKGYKHEQSIAE
jgi:hypothetical protein